jgi:hypothetical protein
MATLLRHSAHARHLCSVRREGPLRGSRMPMVFKMLAPIAIYALLGI